jgi:hypothetical protein
VKRLGLLAAAVVLAASGCGEGEPQAGPSSPTFEDVTDPSPGSLQWLAVFDTADEADQLDDVQEEISAAAPENVTVALAGCWEEVPEELDVDDEDYVAGVVATTPAELRDAVEAVGREPIFEGQVTLIACD